MSKKCDHKENVVWHKSAEDAALASEPLYNGFVCRHAHHNRKEYQRSKSKRAWNRQHWKRRRRQEAVSRTRTLFYL